MNLTKGDLFKSFALATMAMGALTGCSGFGPHNMSSSGDVDKTARETWERNGYNVVSMDNFVDGASFFPTTSYTLEKDGASYNGEMTCFFKSCQIQNIKRQNN